MMEGQDLVSGEVVDEVTLKGVSRPIKIYSLTRPARGAAEGTEGVPAGSQVEESIDDD
jgi:hypothetical protein